MNDKSWLLNPEAIQAAKRCIKAVELELGIKLKLSHPDFLDMLQAYNELTESPLIANSLKTLQQFCTNNTSAKPANILPLKQQPQSLKANTATHEMVSVNGHNYPRFNEQGQSFRGIYRGQPSYR